MATQPRLVNKQFNSPIGLYSEANVREVLERESQILANGAVGINFHNPATGKPANLQNSAVLRMLEEEEQRQRNGHPPGNEFYAKPLRDNIKWPPPEYEQKHQLQRSFKDVVIPGVKRVAWPPPNEGGEYVEHNAVQSQGGPVHGQTVPIRSVASPAPSKPLTPLNLTGIQGGSSPHQSPSLNSPNLNASPVGFRPTTPSRQWAPVQSPIQSHSPNFYPQTNPQYQGNQNQYQGGQNQYQGHQVPQNQYQGSQNQFQGHQNQFQSPHNQFQGPQSQYQSPQNQFQGPQSQYPGSQNQFQGSQNQYPGSQNQYQLPQQQYQPPNQYQQQYQGQQYQQPQNQYQQPQNQYQPSQLSGQSVAAQNQAAAPRTTVPSSPASKPFEPPPSTITLRPKAPVSQAPPPVISSQPATATLRGGKHLRGDLKWPPEEVKAQIEEENRQRMELARGPAFRPRKVHKDYTSFFAQHALNSTYPGYKVPPGTQFYRPI